MSTDKKTVTFFANDELRVAIDRFWHESHIISRSKAIQELLIEVLIKKGFLEGKPKDWK